MYWEGIDRKVLQMNRKSAHNKYEDLFGCKLVGDTLLQLAISQSRVIKGQLDNYRSSCGIWMYYKLSMVLLMMLSNEERREEREWWRPFCDLHLSHSPIWLNTKVARRFVPNIDLVGKEKSSRYIHA